jgi:hydrogenase expression/formation protein HypC
MCLAVPARIVELDGTDAVVDVQGVRRAANVALVNCPEIGDYVLLHAGFAIQKWTPEAVEEYNSIMQEMRELD